MIHRPDAGRGKSRAPGVVFFHGFTGDRMESHWIFVKCARALARVGIASMRFDFYGSGESDGDFREATLQREISDARVAWKFFRRQKMIDTKRVGLLGLSMGGAVAACLAPKVRARALVLWSALAHPTELRALAERTTKLMPGGNGAREYSGHIVSEKFLHGLDRIRPLEAIRKFKNPTLIIHPGNDEHLPAHHPEDFYRAASCAVKEKVIIPGADHTFTSVRWEREVIVRTVEWFRANL